MRTVILAMVCVVACSGSGPAPVEPRVEDNLDAGAPQPSPDAEPVATGPTCVPRQSAPVAYVDATMILCDAAVCVSLAADGALAEVSRFAEPFTLKVDDHSVDVCTAPDACKTIKPERSDIVDAALDAAGARVAIVDTGKPHEAYVEVRDVASGKQLAKTKIKGAKNREGNDWYPRFVGAALLVTEFPRDGDQGERHTLFSLNGSKLKKLTTLEGSLYSSAGIGASLGALVIDGVIDVRDLATGKRVAELDWSVLPAEDTAKEPDVFVLDAGGEVAVVVRRRPAGGWAAGVFPVTGGDPRPIPITACPQP